MRRVVMMIAGLVIVRLDEIFKEMVNPVRLREDQKEEEQ
jgi:hypothetical protein